MLIKHKRFNLRSLTKKNFFYTFPIKNKNYYNFFNNYAKKNYQWVTTQCLCKNNNDALISNVDRYGIEYSTVICLYCGLIRGKKYLRDIDVKNFYKFHWRNIMSNETQAVDPEKYFFNLLKSSKKKIEIIQKYGNLKLSKSNTVLDLGGGIGATGYYFIDKCEVVLADFFEPYLNFARKKGLKIIKGGLNEINFKPDIIIMSHVIEHWSNFEKEIEKLISIQKINHTINYIEFPGVDSLKLGRREGDFLGDIHVPHVYYFTSYVFENLMARYGFKKLYIDSEIKSLFIYTGVKEKVKNYFHKVRSDLILAEKVRKYHGLKNLIKYFIPNKILEIKKNIFKKKINY